MHLDYMVGKISSNLGLEKYFPGKNYIYTLQDICS